MFQETIRFFRSGLFFTLIITSHLSANQDKYASELSSSETDFSFALSQQLTEHQYLFSPYSIYTTLAMTYQGARGKTEQEMQKTLFLKINKKQLPLAYLNLNEMLSDTSDGENAVSFLSANALWLSKNTFILSDFRHVVQDNYQANLQTVDFNSPESTSVINGWVKDKTQDKISHLIEPGDLDALTQMVLTNATYFKGSWANPFDPKNTSSAPFFSGLEHQLTVSMMEQKDFFPYLENELAQVIALPFKSSSKDKFACLLFLPKKNVKISSLEATLSAQSFREQLAQLSSTYVDLKCPKFTMCYRLVLNPILQKMGMSLAFDPQADFSGINGMRNLFISKVVHQAFFDFNESGVVAAAATGASISVKSILETTPVEFNADHPFLFFIVDLNTKTPLFMGKLHYPDGSEDC